MKSTPISIKIDNGFNGLQQDQAPKWRRISSTSLLKKLLFGTVAVIGIYGTKSIYHVINDQNEHEVLVEDVYDNSSNKLMLGKEYQRNLLQTEEEQCQNELDKLNKETDEMLKELLKYLVKAKKEKLRAGRAERGKAHREAVNARKDLEKHNAEIEKEKGNLAELQGKIDEADEDYREKGKKVDGKLFVPDDDMDDCVKAAEKYAKLNGVDKPNQEEKIKELISKTGKKEKTLKVKRAALDKIVKEVEKLKKEVAALEKLQEEFVNGGTKEKLKDDMMEKLEELIEEQEAEECRERERMKKHLEKQKRKFNDLVIEIIEKIIELAEGDFEPCEKLKRIKELEKLEEKLDEQEKRISDLEKTIEFDEALRKREEAEIFSPAPTAANPAPECNAPSCESIIERCL